VALLESQVKVEVSPGATTDGYTLSVTVGITSTVVLAFALPPAPEQESEYEAGADKGPVLCDPLRARAPLQAPAAMQEVALAALQCKVALLPEATAAGVAVRVTTGKGRTETVALAGALMPPGPIQVSE
jgi:hypothetical protein